MKLYSVYDKVAQTFSAPQQDINDATAIRNFTNGINRPSYRDWETDRKSTRLNSSHITRSRMPSSA